MTTDWRRTIRTLNAGKKNDIPLAFPCDYRIISNEMLKRAGEVALGAVDFGSSDD